MPTYTMIGAGALAVPVPASGDGTLYVGHFVSGILYRRASDGTWSTIDAATVGAGNIGAVAVQAGAADIVYVLGSTALRKSTDGGASWSTISNPLSDLGNARGLRCDASGNLYLSAENTPDSGVWRSTNGGGSFTHIVPADSPYLETRMVGLGANRLWWGQSEESEPTADHAHYAALDGSGKVDVTGLIADSDTPVWCRETPGADSPGFIFYAHAAGNQGLVKVEVAGVTQTVTNITPTTIGLNSRGVRDLLALSASTYVALWTDAAAGGTGAIYRTTDGGSSWTVVQAATAALFIPDNGYGPYLAQDTVTSTKLYCLGKQNSIFISTDNGTTWTSETITGAAASNQLASLVIA